MSTDQSTLAQRLRAMADGWLCAGLPDADLPREAAAEIERLRAVLAASERVIQRDEACTTCNGNGWVTRDPDIGTDRECSVCDGRGRVSDA
jgi:hypothetical protein